MKLDALLAPKGYAHGGRISTADAWLTPVRYSLDGLASFAGLSELLVKAPRFAAYREAIDADPALGKVWREMDDGLKAFMQRRASGQA